VKTILNVSAYQFVTVSDTLALRDSILSQARSHALRGTVLLADEGINLALAGTAPALRDFMLWLRADARFADMPQRSSWSDEIPFQRLRVKIKREIIRMDCPAIRPEAGRAAAVDAATLARWLCAGHDDRGRTIAMLDTRNAFEVDSGAFIGAIDWRLSRFGEFPAALAAHKHELAGKTVVTYCTGGIRCEKAALLMHQTGVEHVLQLGGGILNYFAQTRQAPHWRGACFVFDQRTALEVAFRRQDELMN